MNFYLKNGKSGQKENNTHDRKQITSAVKYTEYTELALQHGHVWLPVFTDDMTANRSKWVNFEIDVYTLSKKGTV